MGPRVRKSGLPVTVVSGRPPHVPGDHVLVSELVWKVIVNETKSGAPIPDIVGLLSVVAVNVFTIGSGGKVAKISLGSKPVSYTHLTLPTIYSV